MTLLEQSRASLDRLNGTQCYSSAEIVLPMGGLAQGKNEFDSDVRMDRVIELRRAIAWGTYAVSAADLAQKLMGAMREGPGLRWEQRKSVAQSVLRREARSRL